MLLGYTARPRRSTAISAPSGLQILVRACRHLNFQPAPVPQPGGSCAHVVARACVRACMRVLHYPQDVCRGLKQGVRARFYCLAGYFGYAGLAAQ